VTIKDRHGVPGRAISTGDSVDGRISWRGDFVENVFSGKTSISISMWVQPLKQVDKNSMVFLEYQGGNLSPPGYLSLLSLSAYDLSAMQFHKNNMGDNSQLFEIPINEWAFMTVVTTATDCKGYVDGVCRYKSPIVGALQSGKSPSLSLGGRVSWPGSVPAQYNRINAHAGFDELRIYNRALSAAEVKVLYKYEKTNTTAASNGTPRVNSNGAQSVFPGWQQFAVHQRRTATGCIATGYEMLLRAAKVGGINYDSFQDDFDLDINLGRGQTQPKNNFVSVAQAVKQKYPLIQFEQQSFTTGAEKNLFIDRCLAEQNPVLVSVTQVQGGQPVGWHVMPIVDMKLGSYLLLRVVQANGKPVTQWIDKSQLARIHDQYDGGKEVAFLKGN
jgi:hypothetical protein